MISEVSSGPILLVEDDLNDILLTSRALKKGYVKNEIIVVRDGVEALDYLFHSGKYSGHATRVPEIVLLDLHLPKVEGGEALAQIRASESTRHVPVIILTSARDEQDQIESRNLRAVSYLQKPVGFRSFLEAVSRCGVHCLLVAETVAREPVPVE